MKDYYIYHPINQRQEIYFKNILKFIMDMQILQVISGCVNNIWDCLAIHPFTTHSWSGLKDDLVDLVYGNLIYVGSH